MFPRFRCVCFMLVSMVSCSSTVFAGRVELTTYYPSPTGEYTHLQAKGNNTNNGTVAFQAGGRTGTGLIVTNANKVGIGKLLPDSNLDINGSILLAPTTEPASPKAGMMYYDSTDHVMRYYKDGTDPQWVDLEGGGGGVNLGNLQIKASNTVYHAETDGFVIAITKNLNGTNPNWLADVSGYVGNSAATCTTLVAYHMNQFYSTASITFPVRKGSYWKALANSRVFWQPLE